MKVLNQVVNNNFALYHGDCVDVTKGIPDNSIQIWEIQKTMKNFINILNF